MEIRGRSRGGVSLKVSNSDEHFLITSKLIFVLQINRFGKKMDFFARLESAKKTRDRKRTRAEKTRNLRNKQERKTMTNFGKQLPQKKKFCSKFKKIMPLVRNRRLKKLFHRKSIQKAHVFRRHSQKNTCLFCDCKKMHM